MGRTSHRMWNCKGEKDVINLVWNNQGIADQSMDGFVGKIWTGNPWVFTPKICRAVLQLLPLGKQQSSNQKVVSGMKWLLDDVVFQGKKCFWVNNHEIVGWDLMRWTRCNLQWCFRKCHAKISEAQCYVRKAGLWRLRNQRTAWWLNSRTTNMDIIRIGILKWSKIETKTDILCVCRCVL